jgi:hypothetical protein
MTFKTFYSEAEIEVSLDEWSTQELIEELQSRDEQVSMSSPAPLLTKIYELRRNGQDYQKELSELIYMELGRT